MNRVLIAGVGNIFLGDDGFGVEVAQRLLRRETAQGVQVADFGIRALDLGYALQDALQDKYTTVILVDTVKRGGAPGTVYVIEPEPESKAETDVDAAMQQPSPHDMSPDSVLRFAFTSRVAGQRILLVGCEPESFGTEFDGEGRMGLSEPVASAVDQAIEAIDALLDQAEQYGSQPREVPQAEVAL